MNLQGGRDGIDWSLLTGGIGVLSFDRPPVNALDAAAYVAAADALEDLAARDDARVVVVTGRGTRAFCAGTDTAAFVSESSSAAASVAARRFFETLAASPLVRVGALNGPAVGGGAMIAAECDVLIAATGSYFAIPELQLGVVGGAGHIKRLAPYMKVQRMMLLGEHLTASEARAFGAVLNVLPRDEVLPAAMACASALAQLDGRVVNEARAVFRAPESDAALTSYRLELAATERLLTRTPPSSPTMEEA